MGKIKEHIKPFLVVIALFVVIFSASNILGQYLESKTRYNIKIPSVQSFIESEHKSYPSISSIHFYTEKPTRNPKCLVYSARLSEVEVCKIVLDVRDFLNSVAFRQELQTFEDWSYAETFSLKFVGFDNLYGEYIFTSRCDESLQYLDWRGAFYLAESEIGQSDVFYYTTENGEIVTKEYSMESILSLAGKVD